jgi:NAD(P)H-flavin reductase
VKKTSHTIIEVIDLTPETFILRLDRKNFEFEAGQYVILRAHNQKQGREYSVYSGKADDYLDFLIREIPAGSFSCYLRNLPPGSGLDVEGPGGFFVLDQNSIQGNPAVFIATGTGISPFHSYVKSYPGLNYRVLHGVRYAGEAYGRNAFAEERQVICASQDSKGDFKGRVTDCLKKSGIDKNSVYYLCGNAAMIDDTMTLLENSGIRPENIRSEVYF